MIHEWAKNNSHRWGIAVFEFNDKDDYWFFKTYDNYDIKSVLTHEQFEANAYALEKER